MEALAAGYAEGVLKSSLGTLGSFLMKEARLISSVRGDIVFIRDELVSMNAFLQDLIQAGQLNQQMKVWMVQVLEVACEAELCVDDFAEHLSKRHRPGILGDALRFIHFVRTIVPRYRIAKMIEELKIRVDEVSNRRSRYFTTIELTKPPETKSPETQSSKWKFLFWTKETEEAGEANHSQQALAGNHLICYNNLIAEDALVGMHSRTRKLLRKILSDQGGDSFSVHVITGRAGSGKTAQARMLYRRRNVPEYGICRSAWVAVPKDPDIKLVLIDILRQVMDDPLKETDNYDERMVLENLRQELSKPSRFLLILDSIRCKDDWEKIKPAFANCSHGSRVCVTTRSEEVAQACCSNNKKFIHHVKRLSEEHSKELIFKLLVGRFTSDLHTSEAIKTVCDSFDSVPRPIVLKSQCAILVGASMRMVFWLQRELNITDKLEPDFTVIHQLAWCYDQMSPELKQCSEDLSKILPEGYPIKRKRLTRRWIAQGYVCSMGDLSEEEVAENYFNELISRCVIEPENISPTGKIKCCKIVTLFKDILTFVQTKRNASYNQELLNSDDTVLEPDSSSPRGNIKCCTIPTMLTVIQTGNKNYGRQVTNPDRTLLQLTDILSYTVLDCNRELFALHNHNSMTVLDLEDYRCLGKRDLINLCSCIQLRFLSLRNTDVNHLPERIENLRFLETLDIRQTKINDVPNGITRLRHLKHLLAGYFYKPESRFNDSNFFTRAVKLPKGMENSSALRTLAHVNATRASKLLHAVRELTQLSKLGLVIDEENLNTKPLSSSLLMLSASLRSLSVCDHRVQSSLEFLDYLCFPPQILESLNLRGYLKRLPQWVVTHKHLKKLTLSQTQFSRDAIRLLGRVPHLLCLKLYGNSLKESQLVFLKDEFPVLQVLVVHCTAVQIISFKEGSMPCLQVFKWIFSKVQSSKIHGIENLSKLKEVSLIGQVSYLLSMETEKAVNEHPNHATALVFEVIREKSSTSTQRQAPGPAAGSSHQHDHHVSAAAWHETIHTSYQEAESILK